MTRFMMTIDDAVDLVVYAFENGNSGDTFVQKAPSCTIETLAMALKKVLDVDTPIEIIGTRHGEKVFETLLTREERSVAEDLGDYFRVPADNRDLNYEAYFSKGRALPEDQVDYNSHNNPNLIGVDGMCELLESLEIVRRAKRGEIIIP
jgi:UDP-glucose 4-epimerase